LQQRGNGVGQLDFTAHARLRGLQRVENLGFKNVAAHHGQVAGGVGRVWLFNNARHLQHPLRSMRAGHNAVLIGLAARHLLHGQHATVELTRHRHHLADDGAVRVDHVVGQEHGKRLVAHDGGRAQDGVAQAQGSGLAGVHAFHRVGNHVAHAVQQRALVLQFQVALQFRHPVEMVFDGALVAPGDEDQFRDARRHGFFDGILDQGPVHDGKHFFRHGLGGRKKTGAQAGNRKYRFAYGMHGVALRVKTTRDGCRAWLGARHVPATTWVLYTQRLGNTNCLRTAPTNPYRQRCQEASMPQHPSAGSRKSLPGQPEVNAGAPSPKEAQE